MQKQPVYFIPESHQASPDIARAAGFQNLRIMQTIVHDMKEIPELPSEKPKDTQSLNRVEYPDEGGILTYLGENIYPYRGFPFAEFVERIDLTKKLSRGFLSGLYHELKGNTLKLVLLLPALWVFKKFVHSAIYAFYRIVERSRIKPGMYCQAIRELHRAFTDDSYTEDGKTRQLRHRLGDLLCMVLEFDNAYRFRFQDVIAHLDKPNLKKNPVKELIRLLGIMQSQENGQDINDTWTLLKLFCKLYLRFDGTLKSILVDVLTR